MDGPISVDFAELKELVKHEIESAYRSREDFLWKKGQNALKRLQEETTQHDSLLLEQVGTLQTGLETLTQQQDELRIALKEITHRVGTVVCDVQEIHTSGKPRKSSSSQPWYYANNWDISLDRGLYAPASQANPQAPMTNAQSNGTESEASKLSGASVDSAILPADRKDATAMSSRSEPTSTMEWDIWRKQVLEATRVSTSDHHRARSQEWNWDDSHWDGGHSWPHQEELSNRVAQEAWPTLEDEWEPLSITLYKSAEVPFLGADIHDNLDGTIVLETILPGGLIEQYNKTQTRVEMQIAANDRLTSVNSKSGQVDMRSECHERMKLDLTILHRRATKGKLRASARSFEPGS